MYNGGNVMLKNDYLNYYSQFHQNVSHWLGEMLIHDEIRLKDIPHKIRTSDTLVYVSALRISSGVSCKRFIQDLTVLCDDINMLENEHFCKIRLIETLSDNLHLNDYKGDKEFEYFKQSLSENLLRKLQESDGAREEYIRNQLEKQGFI